ncbi:membrane-bound metallopeptidase [Glaesserella parasuis ZJ0906]|uniref:Membrane-bound metallopeptidase n=1 Tax=Glaesserella parasuis ZJ0906 TaxID=1322346 RepID=A0A806J3E8_GLAPU|nr:membrane-bound metallopeptidase [Glaesserella parasuis ZJ0906]
MKLIKYFALIVLVYAVPTLFTETMAGDLSKIQQKSQALKTKLMSKRKNVIVCNRH